MSEVKDIEYYKKQKRKRLIKLFLMLFIFIVPLQIGTQYYAYSTKYHAQLGFNINGFYPFWDILIWINKFESLKALNYKAGLVLGLSFVTVVIFTMIGQNVYANSVRLNEKKHGSARFAERKDLEDAGLLDRELSFSAKLVDRLSQRIPSLSILKKITHRKIFKRDMKHAVVVGGWEDPKTGIIHTLYHCGVEHVLTNGPTRSGKGVSVVNNTLLAWQGSAFIPDLKGELFQLSAGWRQKHANNIILRFEVYSPDNSVRWNPLDEIRFMTDYENSDAEALALMIVDPDGKGLDGSDGHWKKSSKEIVKALIMHVLYRRHYKTLKTAALSDVDNLMAGVNLDESLLDGKKVTDFSTEERSELLWKEMTMFKHIRTDEHGKLLPEKEWRTHPAINNAGMDMINREGEEKASVISTTKAYFSTYRDPIVQRNMSSSDFHARDLMTQTKPVSLYMIAQPTDKAKALPIMRLLISMIVQKNAVDLKVVNGSMKASYNHKLLMLIDEFPSFGRIQSIQDGISYVAGYGIKMYLIVQDIMQLKAPETYGETESITGNCHIQNVFQPNNAKTAEYFSQMAGTTTVTKTNISVSGGRFSVVQGQVSKSSDEVQRPLLTPDEIMRLPPPIKEAEKIVKAGGMLIYVAGFPVISGKQPLYFKDPVSNARSKVLPPEIRESIHFPDFFKVKDNTNSPSSMKATEILGDLMSTKEKAKDNE